MLSENQCKLQDQHFYGWRAVTIDAHSGEDASKSKNVEKGYNHSIGNLLAVKCVFMLTLIAAICGWLWLLGKGLIAIAALWGL